MKSSLPLLLVALAGFTAPALAQDAAVPPAPLASAVDRAAADLLAKQHIPGVAIAVVRGGTILYERGYGLADTAKQTPVTADTRFEIGSITKQFTAASIVQLARAGKLSLDDPLAKYLNVYPAASAVTIRQMLTHTSGIPEFLDGMAAVNAAGTQVGTLPTIVGRIAAKPLDFAPGSTWEYSNTNYILLGAILERVSGQRYDAYVREHIFAPAGMTQSGFISDERTLPAMAVGYESSPKGIVLGHPLRSEWAGAAGAIVSTVGDLAKWDAALKNGRIVSPADVALLQTAATLPSGKSTMYGYGWFIDTVGGHPRIWHNGGTFGFTTTNALYPSDDEAIIVLENLAQSAPERATTDIFSALHPDVAAKLNTAVAGEDAAITARLREWIKRFETGDIDRSQLTTSMSTALTPALVSQSKEQFATLGAPTKLVYHGKATANGLTVYTYIATFDQAQLSVTMGIDAQGKIASYYFSQAG